ncbi:unnamed protein product, partial [marine sediment metagenome]
MINNTNKTAIIPGITAMRKIFLKPKNGKRTNARTAPEIDPM